ncbi:penicillin-binding transpeptidase domain-containing protein [Streptomyces sp. NPDC059396]|uniref:penicillin-binding transpeptidase domain-containing protein n=1 Tax=Streptomyces sp. NPDC059396 TaxID=3346819 RepID=UPI0036BC12C3
MIRHIRHTALFCLLLLIALLLNAIRIQLVEARSLDNNPANRRASVARYAQPRGDILVEGRTVTRSKDTGELLRYEQTYTQGPLYAPVTGYASQTYGTTLLESAEDDVLSGTEPLLSPLPFLPLWHDITRGRQPGGTVVTTISASLQRAAYEGLAGRRGAVAAIEPTTGRILALVSSPSYDPGRLSGTGREVTAAWNRLTGASTQPMLNRAIRETYPPGSAFKIVTAAAALESRTVVDADAPTPIAEPFVLPGTRTTLPNEVTGCHRASLSYAIRWSCNSVLAGLSVRTGPTRMAETAEGFGFNDSGLRIPTAVVPSRFGTRMSDAELALSSIGQLDTRATPLQMAMVAAAVANGGDLRHPYLVDRITTSDGDVVSHTGERPYRRPMSPATAQQLREMMTEVVRDGTGTRAAIPGATVGGKTGTAQHGVGNSGLPYAWFIAWAQEEDAVRPAVAVAVVVEDAAADRTDISGGGSAAPIARAVMEEALGD